MNNALAFETEGTEAEHFAHLAALQHSGPNASSSWAAGSRGRWLKC